MTIQNQIVETKCLNDIWILFSNSTGLPNWDCLSIWQRFKKFPTQNKWPGWCFTHYSTRDIYLLEHIYYYRPNSKEYVLALVPSLPIHLKDDAQITVLYMFAGRSLHPFWTHWRCLHSGTSIIRHLKEIAKMLHVQIYFKIRFLASTWERIESMLKYLKIIATKFNQLCEMWSQPKVTLKRKWTISAAIAQNQMAWLGGWKQERTEFFKTV